MIVKLLTEHHLEFLSLKGGCGGSSESTHVKMPHCWKSCVVSHMYIYSQQYTCSCRYVHVDHFQKNRVRTCSMKHSNCSQKFIILLSIMCRFCHLSFYVSSIPQDLS